MNTINTIDTDEINNLMDRIEQWLQTLESLKNQTTIESKILDECLYLNERKLDLRFANSSKDIIKIFSEEPEKLFNKADLILALYGDISDKSKSYQRTIAHNTIKRLSRCRKFLKYHLNEDFPRVQWLYHDKDDQSWRFYNFKKK